MRMRLRAGAQAKSKVLLFSESRSTVHLDFYEARGSPGKGRLLGLPSDTEFAPSCNEPAEFELRSSRQPRRGLENIFTCIRSQPICISIEHPTLQFSEFAPPPQGPAISRPVAQSPFLQSLPIYLDSRDYWLKEFCDLLHPGSRS